MGFRRTIQAVDAHADILIAEEVTLHGRRAVVPTITGIAWIFSLNTIALDRDDPFPEGYTLGHIWP